MCIYSHQDSELFDKEEDSKIKKDEENEELEEE